jgi:hypothetical protein
MRGPLSSLQLLNVSLINCQVALSDFILLPSDLDPMDMHTGLPCPVQKVIALLLLVSERPDDQGGRAPNRARQHEQ